MSRKKPPEAPTIRHRYRWGPLEHVAGNWTADGRPSWRIRVRRLLGRPRRRLEQLRRGGGAVASGWAAEVGDTPALSRRRLARLAETRRGRVVWFSYLNAHNDPHRLPFLVALHAALAERGWAMEVRFQDLNAAPVGDAPRRTRLPGAELLPGATAPRRLVKPGLAAAGGAMRLRAGARAFGTAKKLPRRESLRRAAMVAHHVDRALGPTDGPGAALPHRLVLWNQFAAVARVGAAVAAHRGVPSAFAHEGVLPGSFVVEGGGQMADSPLALAAADPPPIDSADCERAEAFLAAVRGRRVTRKAQRDDDGDRRKLAELPGRVFFYAGQNDEAAGFFPRSLPRAAAHSPFFASTLDGLAALQHAARRGGFSLVFKPHPNWRKRHRDAPVEAVLDPAVTLYLPEGNVFDCIDRADATLTILSQVAYLSLIHGTPALLLGRMPLTGWGCCTELRPPGGSPELDAALASAAAGGPPGAQAAFLRHVAVAQRHFLLGYHPDLAPFFPRTVGDAAAELIELDAQPPGGVTRSSTR